MKMRVGLAVDPDYVRAIGLRGEKIVWKAERLIGDGHRSLKTAVEQILGGAPVKRWSRPALDVVVGAQASQVKLVSGLPLLEDAGTLAAIIREGARTFFLANGMELVTTGVRIVEAGAAWAGAIEAPVLDSLERGCRAAGWKVGRVTPLAVALAHAFEDEEFIWPARDAVLEIVRSNDGLVSARRRWSTGKHPLCPPRPREALATLDDDALRFADAYGAARLADREPLALAPTTRRTQDGQALGRRTLGPIIVLIVAAISSLLSPLATRQAERRASARLARVPTAQWRNVVASLDRLSRVSAMLQEVHDFTSTRSHTAEVLAELATGLPDSCLALSLKLNGNEGEMTVLARHANVVLSALSKLPSIGSATIAGSIARQPLVNQEWDRATLQFRVSTDASAARKVAQ